MKTLTEFEELIELFRDLTYSDIDPYYSFSNSEDAHKKIYQDDSVIDRAIEFLKAVEYLDFDLICPSACSDVNFYVNNEEYNDIEIVIDQDIKVYAYDKDVTGYFFLRNPDIKLVKEVLNSENACEFLKNKGFEFFDIHCEE